MFNQKKIAKLEKLVSDLRNANDVFYHGSKSSREEVSRLVSENDELRAFIKKTAVFRNAKGQMQRLK